MYPVPDRDHKESAQVILKVGKANIFRVDQEARDPGKRCILSSKTVLAERPFLPGGQSLHLLMPSADGTRPMHIVGDNGLYSTSTGLNMNPI